MRLFLETGDLADIHWALATGLVEGVTANGVFGAGGHVDPHGQVPLADICRAIPGPVLVDVTSVQTDEIYREGRELAKTADNVVVNVPMSEDGLLAMRRLARDGIRVNTRFIFSAAQALLAAKAGAAYVSPSVSGLGDVGTDGIGLVRHIREIFDNYVLECEILAASIPDVYHFTEIARIGADAASVSPALLRSLLLHPLTDRHIDQSLGAQRQQIAQARAGT